MPIGATTISIVHIRDYGPNEKFNNPRTNHGIVCEDASIAQRTFL